MKKLTPGQISDQFDGTRRGYANAARTHGFGPALEEISQAIADIREQGIDVSLEVIGDASEMAFSLFPRPVVLAVSGVLRVGKIERLFGIATKVNGEAALEVALSNFDIRYEGTHGVNADGKTVPFTTSLRYDFKNDPDALVKFQQEIISFAARNAALEDFDKAQTLGESSDLRKSKLKPVGPKAA